MYIETDSLIFGYDVDIRSNRFYKGEPYQNLLILMSPKKRLFYNKWTLYDNEGSFAVNHPNRIQVFNKSNQDISNFVNQGVSDWTNTQHAYWVYDSYLEKPVTQMIDISGTWQAVSFLINVMFTFYGLTPGSKYTVSWLQWTTDLTKRANVGVYGRNFSNIQGFWDGLSNGSISSTNTLTNTWERVYHTFTISNDFDISNSDGSILFYGQNFINGHTLKISDIELVIKDHPCSTSNIGYILSDQSLIDLKRTRTIDISTVSFYSNSKMYFNGVDNLINIGQSSSFFPLYQFSLEFVIRTNGLGLGQSLNGIFSLSYGITVYINPDGNLGFRVDNSVDFTHFVTTGINLNDDKYHHIICSNDGIYSYIYIDGEYIGNIESKWVGYTQWVTDYVCIGRDNNDVNYYFNGYIDIVKIYNKNLSIDEVNNQFNSLYKRFNI